MTFTVIVGGQAGYGVKKAGSSIAKLFASKGLYVFEMDDYPSVIRGSHNFSVVSCSGTDITSHYRKADLIIALDKRSYDAHKDFVRKGGRIISDDSASMGGMRRETIPITELAKPYKLPKLITGVAAISILAAAIGMDKAELTDFVNQEYKKGVSENLEYAIKIFDLAEPLFKERTFNLDEGNTQLPILSGNKAIALGMASAGLDMYVAYPMTPSTSILHTLASLDEKLGIKVIQAENEISVANMALGASFTGAVTACGTSGGGFALMQETFSLAGISESPVLFVFCSRPGPATGVPTYTGQMDLDFALNAGHGEFQRVVASPGSITDAFYLAGELLWLSWNFQTPTILLTEKHLSESSMTVDLDPSKVVDAHPIHHEGGEYLRYKIRDDGISPLHFPPSDQMIKWSSYEHTEDGITTEDSSAVVRMMEKRRRKGNNIISHLKNSKTVNRFGNPDSPIIITYGSTTMSVLEALRFGGIDAHVLQPIYLRPFPEWEVPKDREVIVVEQSLDAQFTRLLQNNGVKIKHTIKRFDGRPFDPEDLAAELKEVLR